MLTSATPSTGGAFSVTQDQLIAIGRAQSTWVRSIARMLFSNKARADFYEALCVYRKRGTSISDTLRFMWDVETSGGRRRRRSTKAVIIADIFWRTHECGEQFNDALPSWLPDPERMIVSVIGKTGLQPAVLEGLIKIARRRNEMRANLVKIAMPIAALLILVLVLAYGSALWYFPKLEASTKRFQLQGSAADLKAWSQLFLTYGHFATAFVLSLPAFTFWILPRWTGRIRSWCDQLPPFSFYHRWTVMGFLMTLAALVQANKTTPQALAHIMENATPYLRERVEAIARHDDKPLGLAMEASPYGWPDEHTIRSVRYYLAGSDAHEGLQALAERWLDQMQVHAAAAAETASMVSTLMIAGFAAWLTYVTYDLTRGVALY